MAWAIPLTINLLEGGNTLSLAKLSWMLVFGVLITLFSHTAASACDNDRVTLNTLDHISHTESRSPTISSDRIKDQRTQWVRKNAAKGPNSLPRTNWVPALLVDDDDEPELMGSCIHNNGCTCSGPKSHKRGCGTEGDCHAHPGLICTWGGGSQ